MALVAEDWLKTCNQQEKNIMIRWAQKARIIVTYGYFLMGIGYTTIIILPLLGISITDATDIVVSGKMLPLSGYYIYSITKWPQYEITYVSNVIILFFCSVTFTAVDNFLGLLVLHICGQLDILRHRLICLSELGGNHDLKSCVMTHIRLLRCSKL